MTENATAPKKKTKRRWVRAMFYFLLLLVVGISLVFLFGPREPVDLKADFDPASLGDDLDAYLAASERALNVEPDFAKQIVWAFPSSKAKTPIAIASIHGYSATKGEIQPVPQRVAEALQANIYYARLAGHGLGSAAMTGPTVHDWMNDTAEAIAIANRIGEKTILLTVSTGGTFAALAAMDAELSKQIDGIIFISPNFKIANWQSAILTFPFARTLVPAIAGKERNFETRGPLHEKYWTSRYDTVALLPMAASVIEARRLPYSMTKIPALFIYSENDTVIDQRETARIASIWGGPVETEIVNNSADLNNHVIAGDALSPNTNDLAVERITKWISAL